MIRPSSVFRGRTALLVGGIGSLSIALLHVMVIFVGAPAYIYFGAARLARMAQQFFWYPTVITAFLALVFLLWAAYAFAGAGVLHWRLPVIQHVLVAIGVIYTLRGLVLVSDLVRLARGAGYPFRQTVFSAIALALGILHLIGSAERRRRAPDQAF